LSCGEALLAIDRFVENALAGSPLSLKSTAAPSQWRDTENAFRLGSWRLSRRPDNRSGKPLPASAELRRVIRTECTMVLSAIDVSRSTIIPAQRQHEPP
jgi:hypothetical protein